MKKILLLLTLFLASTGNAQRFDWVRFISSATTDNSVGGANDMVRDADGNLYTMSTYNTDILVNGQVVTHEGLYYNQNVVVIKWNPDGEILAFKKVYAQSFGLNPHHLAFDFVNDQLLLSTDVSGQPVVIPDDDVSLSNVDTAVQILRFDSDLEFVSNIPHYFTYACPMATHDGFTYYAHGYNSKIFKVNAQNEVQWTIIPAAGGGISVYGITVAPDGNVFISGRVTFNSTVTLGDITINVPEGNGDQLVVFKISPEGEVLAGSYVTRSTSSWTRMPLIGDADGNLYLMAGYFAPNLSIGDFPLANVANGNDAFLVKFNENLEPLWVTQFHQTEGNMMTNGLAISDSGHIITTGRYTQTGNFGGWELPYTPNGSGFMTKTDPANGDVIYAARMSSTQWTGDSRAVVANGTSFYFAGYNGNTPNGVSFGCFTQGTVGMFLTKIEDIPYSQPEMELTYTNGVLVTDATATASSYQWFFNNALIEGATQSTYTPTQVGTYSVIAQFPFGCSSEQTFSVTELATFEFTKFGFRVFPNPTNGNFTIESDLIGNHKVEIVDLNGRVVFSSIETFSSAGKTIDLPQLTSGMYLLRIGTDNILTSKLIIK
ncbi:MAG: T9SS type A sorting domain-containing protein [Flavobacterium sp.]|uniref:T9SS type A sorting domain-containing protein n=1 Tax=Flavobacterium sp. TaxID=239 RepID=UPI0012101C51|nr:T9SS type A sorting domain-containing protein [Flavobacterium sp.]RZJ68035.1 MAG: T9SS type A sorting domain-containing protein [Flavobacterium sp.]